MKEKEDYIRDIAEVRNMMERSSRFRSLSGLSGVFAGVYALTGAFVAWRFFDFGDGEPLGDERLLPLLLVALTVLVLTVGTAFFLSNKKAQQQDEKIWNNTTRRLLVNMSVPLIAGGVLLFIFIAHGLLALVAPFSLLFYGLAQFTAGKYSFEEMRSLGIIEIVLGLLGAYFTDLGLLLWAVGFGLVHIVYGIYIHYRYDK